MKRMLVVIFALMTAHAAVAEELTLEQVFSGKTIPLTLKLKDLDGTWCRFAVGGGGEQANTMAMIRAMSGAGGLTIANVYYSKGKTVTVSGDTYLIVYRAQSKAINPQAIAMAAMRGGQPPEPQRPTALTPLALTLLNLRQNGSFADIHPFNLDAELSGAEPPSADEDKGQQEANEASLKNLRLIGTALLTYVTERKALPVMTDAKAAREELVLYLRNPDVLDQPNSQTAYQPNPALSGHKPGDFDKPEKTVAFYESAPGADDTRGVLFLDGHAERVAEQQWKHLKEISHLP